MGSSGVRAANGDTVPNRSAIYDLLLGAGGCALFAWVGVRPEFNGLLSDSYVYLAAAEALRDDPSLLAHIFANYPFPPLFPLALAAVGGGSAAPERSYWVGAVALAAVLLLFSRWLRSEGVPQSGALLAAVTFALLPATLQTAMGVLSEPLFMVCVFGAMLALPSPSESARDRAGRLRLAALCVAAASLTRSVGIAAIVAFVLCWGRQRGWRATRGALLVAALPFALWTALKALTGAKDYSAAALVARAPLRVLAANLEAWRAFTVQAVDSLARPHSAIALSALGVIAALVWLQRLLRGRFDAYYLAAYLAIVAVWPFPHHAGRFLFAVLPIVLGYAVLGAGTLLAHLNIGEGLRRRGSLLVPGALLLLALPSTGTLLSALWRQEDPALAVAMRAPSWSRSTPEAALKRERFGQRLVAFQRAALAQLPQDACVASVIPQQVLVYGARRGVDLTQIAARGQTLEEALAACPYVLMIAARPYPPIAGIGSLFPLDALGGRMEVIAMLRERPDAPDSALLALLVRIR